MNNPVLPQEDQQWPILMRTLMGFTQLELHSFRAAQESFPVLYLSVSLIPITHTHNLIPYTNMGITEVPRTKTCKARLITETYNVTVIWLFVPFMRSGY